VQLESCTYICNLRVAHYKISNMKKDVFLAIADPTRRAILTLLTLQAMTPNAIAEHFDSTRQGVSKHIKMLAECKLVKPEYSGREIYYHLNSKELIKELDSWMDQFRKHWDARFNQLDEILRSSKATKK